MLQIYQISDRNTQTEKKNVPVNRQDGTLPVIGWGEEAMGHNAIVAGFQGQHQWNDYMPIGDF